MVIFSPIPGQEERNSDHLLEEGAAVKCNELTTMPYKIDRLLSEPGRLAAMRRAAAALGRPHAARTIVQTLSATIRLPWCSTRRTGRDSQAAAGESRSSRMERFLASRIHVGRSDLGLPGRGRLQRARRARKPIGPTAKSGATW